MVIRHGIALVFALLPMLGGCASKPPAWARPGATSDAAAADYLACRRWADRALAPGYQGIEDDRGGNPLRQYDREVLKRRLNALAADCMADKGYVPARPANSTP